MVRSLTSLFVVLFLVAFAVALALASKTLSRTILEPTVSGLNSEGSALWTPLYRADPKDFVELVFALKLGNPELLQETFLQVSGTVFFDIKYIVLCMNSQLRNSRAL
jgi:hypothetical protein